jgi:uncharacterized protein (TIGR03382 family)
MASTQLQYISQNVPTLADNDYELTFWLRRPVNVLSLFVVRWEGDAIFGQHFTLPTEGEWHRFTFPVHANSTGSLLEFGQTTFPLEWHIDDVSVVQVPGPSAAPLLLMGGAVVLRRRREEMANRK